MTPDIKERERDKKKKNKISKGQRKILMEVEKLGGF